MKKVVCIFIAQNKGGEMCSVDKVNAIAGCGLEGDRYCTGNGSFNQGKTGSRQVTFINHKFMELFYFPAKNTRRNIVTKGVELNWLIGREFSINGVKFKGVKYCDPCERPTVIGHLSLSFKELFQDCGGIIAEILTSGEIKVDDEIVEPDKGY